MLVTHWPWSLCKSSPSRPSYLECLVHISVFVRACLHDWYQPLAVPWTVLHPLKLIFVNYFLRFWFLGCGESLRQKNHELDENWQRNQFSKLNSSWELFFSNGSPCCIVQCVLILQKPSLPRTGDDGNVRDGLLMVKSCVPAQTVSCRESLITMVAWKGYSF